MIMNRIPPADFRDEDYEMPLASEIASMASSASAMDKQELEEEVIMLRTQLLLAAAASQLKRTKAANKDLHAG